MNKKAIHLVSIVPSSTQGGLAHIPWGILYVGSYLKKHNFDVFLHHIDEKKIGCVVSLISDSQPLWVGVSVLSGLTTEYAADFSSKLKAIMNVDIVWGGVHASLMYQQTIQQSYVDFIIRGYGEDSTVDFATQHFQQKDFAKIPGLVYKQNTEIIVNSSKPYEKNIDKYSIDFSLINLSEYVKPDLNSEGLLSIFSSRGCPYNCSFCSTRATTGNYWAGHSVEYLINLIQSAETHVGNIRHIRFSDDNVMIDIKRGEALIAALFQKGKLCDSICIRLSQLNEKILDIFKKYQVKSLFLGFESGSDRILTLMNKKITTKEIKKKLELLKHSGIVLWLSGIVGVPTESWKEILLTINFALTLRDQIDEGVVSLFRFAPLPGTPLTELAGEEGFLLPERPEEWGITDPSSFKYEMTWLPWITNKINKRLFNTQQYFRSSEFYKYNVHKQLLPFRVFEFFFNQIGKFRIRHGFFWGMSAEKLIKSFVYNPVRTLNKLKKCIFK